MKSKCKPSAELSKALNRLIPPDRYLLIPLVGATATRCGECKNVAYHVCCRQFDFWPLDIDTDGQLLRCHKCIEAEHE